jgi:excisionase family DNA binding protein
MIDNLFSVKEAAEALRIAPVTLRLWVSQGKLPCVFLGRRRLLREKDIQNFIIENLKKTRRDALNKNKQYRKT